MYQIYSRVGNVEVCLHDSMVVNPTVKLDSPTLTLEDSKAGSLSFKMAPNNIGYGTYEMRTKMASGTDYQTPIDLAGGLTSGTVNESGAVVSSDTNLISALTAFPANTTGIRFNQLVASNHDSIDSFTQESSDILISPQFNTASSYVHTVDAGTTSAWTDHDLTGQLTRQHLDFKTGTGPMINQTVASTKHLLTPIINVWTGVKVRMDVATNDDELRSKLRYTVMFFLKYDPQTPDTGGAEVQSMNGLDDLTGFFHNRQNVTHGTTTEVLFSHMRIEFYLEDGSDLDTTDIPEITMTFENTGFEFSVVAYNSSDEEIGHSDYTDVGAQSDPVFFTNQSYVKYRIRRRNGLGVSSSDITDVVRYVGNETQHRIHYYMNSGEYVGQSEWISGITLQNGIQSADKFRCEYRYKAETPLSTTSVIRANVVPTTTKYVDKVSTVDLVGRMSSTILVYRFERVLDQQTGVTSYQKKLIWEGRVVSETKDFKNMRSIKCEGDLAYLNDTYQPGKDYGEVTVRQFLTGIISVHNSKVSEARRFELGVIWVSDTYSSDDGINSKARRSTNYQKTLDCLNSVIKQYGGHLKVRRENGKRYIDWYEKTGSSNQSVQTINFGENLLDFTTDWDMTKLCTVVLPTGKVEEAKEGNKNAGDKLDITITERQLLYLDDDGRVQIESGPNLAGYKTAIAVVEPDKNYYFSGRLHGGYVAYVIKSEPDGSGDYFAGGTKTAGSSTQVGFEDFVDYKITTPHYDDKTKKLSIVMCSFGDGIQLALKNEIEGVDHYVTVDQCDDDGTWHKKGSLYVVNQAAVDKYGWIEAHISKNNINTKEQLYKVAKNYLQQGQFDEMTINLSAVDMNLLGVDTSYIDLLDNVRVISPPHGLDKIFPVTKIEIPIDRPAEQKISLGSTSDPTLTTQSSDVDQEVLAKLEEVPTYDNVVISARKEASSMINTASTGYISFVRNVDTGAPMELVFSSLPDYKDKQANIWRWNMKGLGYSPAGNKEYNEREYISAITADGEIVADVMTAGTLRGIQIEGCTITSTGRKDGHAVDATHPEDCKVIMKNGSYYMAKIDGTETARITPEWKVDVGGNEHDGIAIQSDVIMMNSDAIWVKDTGTSGQDYAAGQTVTFTFYDTDGYAYWLSFKNGILVDWEQRAAPQPEPDPEEEEE